MMHPKPVALLVSLTLGLATIGVSPPAHAQNESRSAFDRIASCVSGGGRLLLLAVVDESASLKRTDPKAIRVDALETVVRNVAQLGDQANGASGVEIGFGSFATDFELLDGWKPANAETAAELSGVARSFAQRDSGIDTDFAAAFAGARDALDARGAEIAGETGKSPCKVLLTFTDGEYDLEARARETFYAPGLRLDVEGNPEAAIAQGRALLCESGGVADQLHETAAVVLTVGLGSSIDDGDQQFLQSVSTGRGCGDVEGEGLGAWISAQDLQGLVFAFDEASSGIAGGAVVSDQEITPCRLEACPSGTTSFVLDESLSQFHLLIAAPDPLLVELRAPDGSRVAVDAGLSRRVSGAKLKVVELKAASIVEGKLPLPAAWAGEWTVTFVDPTGEAAGLLGRAHVVLFGGLTPVIETADGARVGEPMSVRVRAVGEDGAPRAPEGFVAQVATRLFAVDPTSRDRLPVTDGGPGPDGWTYTIDVPSGLQTSSIELRARVDVTTAGGVRLPSTESAVTVAVAPPASFPRIEPGAIDFGATTGTENASASVRIVGGNDPGCVVFGDPTVDAGPRADDVSVVLEGGDADGECLPVAVGSEQVLSVVLKHSENVSADIRGTLPVTLRSDVSSDEISQDIPMSGQFVRVVDTVKRAEIFVVLVALGLLLPLVVLYLLNRHSARFRRPAEERVAEVDVRATPAGALERGAEAGYSPFWLDATDFEATFAPPGDLREFSLRGVSFESVVPAWPLLAPYGRASVPGGSSISAAGDMAVADGRTAGRLPFGLSGQWVFIADAEQSGNRTGRVLVFLNGATAFDDVAERLVGGIELNLVSAVHGMPASCFRTNEPEGAGRGSEASSVAASVPGIDSEFASGAAGDWAARHYGSPRVEWVEEDEQPPREARRSFFTRRRRHGSETNTREPTKSIPSSAGWTPPDLSIDSDDWSS